MKTLNHEQYSDEWWSARRGLPTASQFGRIVGKTGKLLSGADTYIHELVAEGLLPDSGTEMFQSDAMANGSETEDEARRWYDFRNAADSKTVGLCLSGCGRYGASPDALVGRDGLLEIKCPLPKTHIGYLASGKLPDVYKAQVHGELLVTGREWADFMSYHPDLPPMVVRVEPDAYTIKLADALDQFCEKLANLQASMRESAEAMGYLERVVA